MKNQAGVRYVKFHDDRDNLLLSASTECPEPGSRSGLWRRATSTSTATSLPLAPFVPEESRPVLSHWL